MSSTYTAPIVHADIKALAAIWPPTSDVAREAGHKPQSPLRAIRAKCLRLLLLPGQRGPALRGGQMPVVAIPGR